MFRMTMVLAAVTLLVGPAAAAQGGAQQKEPVSKRRQAVTESDLDPDVPSNASLLRKQLLTDQAMLKVGEVAAKKAASPQVRAFAQRVVDERKKHIAHIERLAKQRDLNLEAEIEKEPLDHAMDDARAAMVKAIPAMDGPELDRAWLAWMILEQDWQLAELPVLKPYLDQTFSSFVAQSISTQLAARRVAYKLLGTVDPGPAQARRAPPRR